MIGSEFYAYLAMRKYFFVCWLIILNYYIQNALTTLVCLVHKNKLLEDQILF